MFFDQHGNGREAERLGFGRSLPFSDLTEEGLLEAVRDVLEEPSYAEKARELGALLVDHETRSVRLCACVCVWGGEGRGGEGAAPRNRYVPNQYWHHQGHTHSRCRH